MKNRKIICINLCFLSIFCLLFPRVSATQVDDMATVPQINQSQSVSSVNGCHGLDATGALLGVGQLVENIEAAFVYEANSETVMYAWNPDVQMYPASIVKIMTALIAVEEGDITETITVTDDALSLIPYDAVSVELQANEQLTMEDLLYCLLMGSANDAAAVIAEYISGSQEAFVQKMNDYASELGCIGTNFVNVHGLHDNAQLITARDAARILAAAMKHEQFREIFTALNYTVEKTNKSEVRNLKTGNYLMDSTRNLYYDPRVVGGRTGVSEDGKRCLAAVSENNGMELISVVMGAESVYQEDGYTEVTAGGYVETKKLLDAALSGYKTAQVLYANQAIRQCAVMDGDNDVVLGSNVSVSTVLPDGVTEKDLTLQYTDMIMQAPVEIGQKLSHVQVWYGNMCVAETDLYAMNAVRSVKQDVISGAVQESSDGIHTVAIVIFAVVSVAVAVLLFVRFGRGIRVLIMKSRNRKYRRNRRRNR